MPYIPKKKRCDYNFEGEITDVGELNYAITMICMIYLSGKQERYKIYNDIIGALECAKLEMYRRKVTDYEDIKKDEHGDVYDLYD